MLGLSPLDLLVVLLYLAGITAVGMRSSRGVKETGDFFMGGRRFGKLSMIAKAFGVGTRVDHVVAITGVSYQTGISGVWYQWLYIFSTPFYWLITPIYRRLRYVTTGDFFQERYGTAAAAAYTVGAMLFLALEIGMVLRATAITVEAITKGALSAEVIILAATAIFIGYGSAGGLVAAVSTKVLQSAMILALSLILIPFAFPLVGGFEGLHRDLPAHMLDLFSSPQVTPYFILMVTVNGLVGIVAMPHHMAIGGAGRSEINCRTGWTYGNIVKRFATLAWAITGIMGAALFPGLAADTREHAFGTMVLNLLPVGLVGLVVAAMLASLMAVCDAYMVDGSALFTRNVFARIAQRARVAVSDMKVARISAIAIAGCGVLIAFVLPDVVTGLTLVWKLMAFLGIPFWMAVFWRRGNRYGLWASLLVTTTVALVTQALGWNLADQILVYLPAGVVAFVAGSLLTRPEPEEQLRAFYTLLHTPVGEEQRLADAGIPIILSGQSERSPTNAPHGSLEEQGHSLLLVDLLNLHRTFSFRKYRVDILGFIAATVLILLIIGSGIVLSRLGT